MNNEVIELLEPFEEIKKNKSIRPEKEYWAIVLLTLVVMIIVTIMIINKK